jgi:hypothetical protein
MVTSIITLSLAEGEVLGREEGPLQRQQAGQGGFQGNIVAVTVAAMQAANGGNHIGPKKIDNHLKPKILGKEFTTSELRTLGQFKNEQAAFNFGSHSFPDAV